MTSQMILAQAHLASGNYLDKQRSQREREVWFFLILGRSKKGLNKTFSHLSGWISGPQLYINANLKYWVFFKDKISFFQTLSNCLSQSTVLLEISIQILSTPLFEVIVLMDWDILAKIAMMAQETRHPFCGALEEIRVFPSKKFHGSKRSW